MRSHLHKFLYEACSLDVSILSQQPENSRADASFSYHHEIPKSQLGKSLISNNCQNCFHSVLQPTQHRKGEDENVKCSKLSSDRVEYIDTIEAVLLVENENLRNHNKFLLEQVKKMYQREKQLKNQTAAHQATIASLMQLNQELENTVRILANDLKSQIHSIQLHLLDHHHPQEGSVHCQYKKLHDCESAQTNSQTVSQSLRTIKQIFGKDEDEELDDYEEWNLMYEKALNPEKYGMRFDLDTLEANKFKQCIGSDQNIKRTLSKNMSNHPIIRDLQEKINHLNFELVFTAKNSPKSIKDINIKKLKQMPC